MLCSTQNNPPHAPQCFEASRRPRSRNCGSALPYPKQLQQTHGPSTAKVTQPAPFPLDRDPPSRCKHRGSEENRCRSSAGGDRERGNSNYSSTRMLMLDLDQYHGSAQSTSYLRVTFQKRRAMYPISLKTIQPHQRQDSNAPGNGKHLFSAPPSIPPLL